MRDCHLIKFSVCGKYVGKERPRKGTNGVFYTPRKTKDYERLVREAWLYQSGQKIDGAISIKVEAYKKPASSLSKAKKKSIEGNPCMIKPDLDNIVKSVTDALNGYAYDDDSQICSIIAEKRYGNQWADDDWVVVTIKKDEEET